MMTSEILKFVEFTKVPNPRHLENEAEKIKGSSYNQGLFYCQKKKFYSEDRFLPLKIGPKSKNWPEEARATLKLKYCKIEMNYDWNFATKN